MQWIVQGIFFLAEQRMCKALSEGFVNSLREGKTGGVEERYQWHLADSLIWLHKKNPY